MKEKCIVLRSDVNRKLALSFACYLSFHGTKKQESIFQVRGHDVYVYMYVQGMSSLEERGIFRQNTSSIPPSSCIHEHFPWNAIVLILDTDYF